MNIGVLAVQGAFYEHIQMLNALQVNSIEIRQKSDLFSKSIDGLIIPGGESTVMGKLIKELGLFEPMQEMITSGTPVFGTCAGLILLAKEIANEPATHFDAMDIVAKRNAYGRQLGSFQTVGSFADISEIPMTFIRAPYIQQAGSSVKVLATVEDHMVAACQNNILVTAFHPELTGCTTVHKYFLDNLVGKSKEQ